MPKIRAQTVQTVVLYVALLLGFDPENSHCQTQDSTLKTHGAAINRIRPWKTTAKWWCRANRLSTLFGTVTRANYRVIFGALRSRIRPWEILTAHPHWDLNTEIFTAYLDYILCQETTQNKVPQKHPVPWYTSKTYLILNLKVKQRYVMTSISFQTFFVQAFKIVVDFLNIQYVIAIHLMRWLNNFYDFRFKWTATTAIGIYPTKARLS